MDALTLITPPKPLIDVADAKEFLRVTHDDEDRLIADLIETATGYLDGPNGLLGRSLGKQSWRLMLDGFPTDGIEVPLPPLISVDLIRFTLPDGSTADLPPSAYRVAIPGAAPALIRPVGLWATTAPGEATVEVQFTAGYAVIETPEGEGITRLKGGVPAPIRAAILQHVAVLYENRGLAIYSTASFQTVPFAGMALIQPYVRWSFGA